MSILVAIEGADGVGKNTAATGLVRALRDRGRSATLLSFPRYQETAGGQAIGDFLAGRMQVPVTPQAAAVLYALDRLESRAVILAAARDHQVVVFDRYIASNMAYQAAKVPAGEARAMMDWIVALETDSFALPRPDLSIYLDTPWELARAMILQKQQRSYTTRSFDEHEADVELQQRVRANYQALVAAGLLGPWQVLNASRDGVMQSREAICGTLLQQVEAALDSPASAIRLLDNPPGRDDGSAINQKQE